MTPARRSRSVFSHALRVLATLGVACGLLVAVDGGNTAASAAVTCMGKTATIVGTHGDDVIRGTKNADVIHGLSGDDVISGLGGNDLICAGSGNDTVYGSTGHDSIYGGPGNDELHGQSSGDYVHGGDGDDEVRGGTGRDILVGGAGRDYGYGGDHADGCRGMERRGSCTRYQVLVHPGDAVNKKLSSHGEGTVFYLRAGVYKRVTLKPRSNQKIIGEPGAILDGEGVTADGIGSAAANGIVIKGLEIRNYTDKCVEWGAQGYGRNWRIENNDIHHCAVGIKVKSDNTYVGNMIHHNRIYGISGSGDNIKVIGNEISYNRTDTSAAYGNSGATKFASTTNLVLRDNHVHHNYGHGLWTDGHTKNALIEDNRVVANHGNGIFHELGYGPTIRNNWVEGNGTGQSGRGADGAGISVFSTFDAVVSGNTVKNNVHGIVGKHDERCCERSGAQWKLKNLRVTGNTVTMDEGYTGLYDLAAGDDVYSSSWNNVFADNTYTLQPSSGTFFLWKDPDPGTATHERLTLTQWRKVQTGDR